MAAYIRNHWVIENHLHWQLEVTFGEDEEKIRRNLSNQNAIINLHLIRKGALLLLKKLPEKISIKREKRKHTKIINILKCYFSKIFDAENLIWY